MSANMPILWQNCLLQYSTETARKAWVWFAETRGAGRLYEADRYANEVEDLILTLQPMLAAAQRIHEVADEVMDDLTRFILLRHANWRLGGNIAPCFLGGPAQ